MDNSDQGTFKKAKWQLGSECPSSYSTLKPSIASQILTTTGAPFTWNREATEHEYYGCTLAIANFKDFLRNCLNRLLLLVPKLTFSSPSDCQLRYDPARSGSPKSSSSTGPGTPGHHQPVPNQGQSQFVGNSRLPSHSLLQVSIQPQGLTSFQQGSSQLGVSSHPNNEEGL
jgi:hypothetical protein